jgi:hypothetical protein
MIIKQLDKAEIARIGEIDRSEHVTLGYIYEDGALKTETINWQVSRWRVVGCI